MQMLTQMVSIFFVVVVVVVVVVVYVVVVFHLHQILLPILLLFIL